MFSFTHLTLKKILQKQNIMKTLLKISTVLMLVVLVNSCAKQDASAILSNESLRSAIMGKIAGDHEMSMQMMDTLMNNTHGKMMLMGNQKMMQMLMGNQEMMQSMMKENPEMMNSMMSTEHSRWNMMDHMFSRANTDNEFYKEMQKYMTSHSNMMDMMQGMMGNSMHSSMMNSGMMH